MLYICISFDYELFMGENYVEERKVLIEPSEALSKMLAAEGVSGCFFADVCCPMQYRKMGMAEFPELFDKQLQDFVQAGHDVQLHIHPHWLKATEVGRHVKFDRQYYRLHNWQEESDNAIADIIHTGTRYLYDVITPVDPDYQCVAYRAGGYCLQPEQQLAEILYREGIRIDSSVCQGFSHIGDGMQYDYRDVPPCSNFYFSREHSISEDIRSRIPGGILEVPVGSYGTFPYRIISSKLNGKISDSAPKGHSMTLAKKETDGKRSFIQRIRNSVHAVDMVTFDFYDANSMKYMIKRIYSEMDCKNSDVFIATIAHPKGLSKEHIEHMSRVIRNIKKNKGIRFVNMRDIADICGLL